MLCLILKEMLTLSSEKFQSIEMRKLEFNFDFHYSAQFLDNSENSVSPPSFFFHTEYEFLKKMKMERAPS